MLAAEAPKRPELNIELIRDYLAHYVRATQSIFQNLFQTDSGIMFARKTQKPKPAQRVIEIYGGSGNGDSKKSKWKRRRQERNGNKNTSK